MDGINHSGQCPEEQFRRCLVPGRLSAPGCDRRGLGNQLCRGCESLGEGAVQIKFVTKSGTNNWHGGVFDQERNTYFNAKLLFQQHQPVAARPAASASTGRHGRRTDHQEQDVIFFNYEVFDSLPRSIPDSSPSSPLRLRTASTVTKVPIASFTRSTCTIWQRAQASRPLPIRLWRTRLARSPN